jgi:hypothetical protein
MSNNCELVTFTIIEGLLQLYEKFAPGFEWMKNPRVKYMVDVYS